VLFLKRAVRGGYSCELKCLSDLLLEADAHLFWKIGNNKEHSIRQLLPPAKTLPMKLRQADRQTDRHKSDRDRQTDTERDRQRQGSYRSSIVKFPDFSSHEMTISLTLSKQ